MFYFVKMEINSIPNLPEPLNGLRLHSIPEAEPSEVADRPSGPWHVSTASTARRGLIATLMALFLVV
ncbi:MAG: hypothetical protein K8S20_15180 [Chloroflexi bacterium]|nr:hypothetical protein [Chloroflexota bacterium]